MDLDKLEKEVNDFEKRVNELDVDISNEKNKKTKVSKKQKAKAQKKHKLSNKKTKAKSPRNKMTTYLSKIFTIEKSSKKKPAKIKNTEDLEVDIEDVKEVVEKDWRYIIGTGVLLAILVAMIGVAIPNTYESSSIISLNIDEDNLFLLADAKIILESSIILQPVIDEFYDEKPSLNKFVLKNINVEFIEGRASVKDKRSYAPYLILTVTSDGSSKSKNMNQMIVDNFISYAQSTGLFYGISEDIEFNNEQISEMKADLEKLNEVMDYRIKYDLDGDELNDPKLLARIRELENQISDAKGQEITGPDGNLYYGKIAYINKARREIDDIKEELASDNYLLSEQIDVEERLSVKLFDNLQDFRDELTKARSELIDLEKEKLGLNFSYIAISEPSLEDYGRFSQSLIKLKQTDSQDVSQTLSAKTLLTSSQVLNPVLEKHYEDYSLNELKKDLTVEHLTEKLDVQNVFIMPYLSMIVKAESSEKAKEISEDIIDSFSLYMKRSYNEEIIDNKIKLKKEEIEHLESSIEFLESELYAKEKLRSIYVVDLKLLSLELNERLNILELENIELNQELAKGSKYELISEPQESIYEVVKFNLLKTSTLSFLAGIFGSFFVFIYYHITHPRK